MPSHRPPGRGEPDRTAPGPGTPAPNTVVEGPLLPPQPGVHALVVETGRVVLGVADADGARLIELSDGRVRVLPWVCHDLTAVDADQRKAGRRLARRTADREGTPWEPTSPWHVSSFEQD